jgi:predicted nucleic acid-binding protein
MLVVDTSVAVKWVVPEDDAHREMATDKALELLAHGLIAPDCIVGEFANALFRKMQRGEIGIEQAREALGVLPDIVNLVPTPPLVPAAFDFATRLLHPVHDCVFLALAVQHDMELVTADAKFVRHCRGQSENLPVRLLE